MLIIIQRIIKHLIINVNIKDSFFLNKITLSQNNRFKEALKESQE